MEAAERAGVSLKRFRGWEPVTRHWRRGRESFSQPEVEWDELQQGWMVALALWRERRCPGCGGDLADTADPANDDQYRYHPPLQCFRCVAFSQSHEVYDTEPHPRSLIHLVPQRPGKQRRG